MPRHTADGEGVSTNATEAMQPAEHQKLHSLKGRLAAFKKHYPPLYPSFQTAVYLLILFLAIQSYFYGSLFRTTTRVHNLHVLAVDYDQGIIGTSVRAAYEQLQGPGLFTLVFQDALHFPDPDTLEANICGDRYWGVLYTQRNASIRLETAVRGNASAAAYDPAQAATFVYSGTRYPVVSEEFLLSDMAQLTAVATQILYARMGSELLAIVDRNEPNATKALFQPIGLTRVERHPAPQGAAILLNSFTMIIPPLMQFFFIMALDHISLATRTFAHSSPLKTYLARLAGSTAFGLCGSLSVSGCIWAFRETWAVTGVQFFETWFVFWFYVAISYLVMDSIIGTIVPMRYAPFFIFSFVILSVTSTLYPFELNPGFYRVGYAVPAHAVWWLLMQVWSDGCVAKLDVALPVLFAWWIVGHCTSALAVWRKCRAARRVQVVAT